MTSRPNYLAGCHVLLGGAPGVPGSGLLPGEGPVELGRGMEMLRRAVASGSRNVEWMRRDPNLDPLGTRRDFQDLMRDLAAPTQLSVR